MRGSPGPRPQAVDSVAIGGGLGGLGGLGELGGLKEGSELFSETVLSSSLSGADRRSVAAEARAFER